MMSIKKEIIEFDELRFMLCLQHDGELSFYFEVPREISKHKTDPLWHTFDERDVDAYGPEWVSDFNRMPKKIAAFRIKQILFEKIVGFILKNRVDYFWFQANTMQKARIYELLRNKLVEKLGQKTDQMWSVQYMGMYFYFNKQLSACG